MTDWLEDRPDWLGDDLPEAQLAPAVPENEALTIGEAARSLGVTPLTVKKYLALDPEEGGPIPFAGWFRLPGGHIRVYRWAVEACRQ